MTPETIAAKTGISVAEARKRLRESGAWNAPGDAPAPFVFYASIFGSTDIDAEYHTAAHELQRALVAKLRGTPWNSKLKQLSLAAVVLDPAVGLQSDYLKCGRTGTVDVFVNIGHSLWTKSDRGERRRLLAQNFAWSMRRIPPSHITDADRAAALAALASAATAAFGRRFIDDGTAGPVTEAAPQIAPAVVKLYRITGEKKEYWETWVDPAGHHIVHLGELGTQGERMSVKASQPDPSAVIAADVARMRAQGFAEISADEHARLVIEFPLAANAKKPQLEKRHQLENKLDQILGWTGLGHCDGGSAGDGTMEVFCFVVDFDLARQVIETQLAKTAFAGFSSIYELTD